MHISYGLAILILVYFIYMLNRYTSLYSTIDTDSQNATQLYGTPIFVALIQRKNSPDINLKAARETWLQGIDNHVFSEKEGTWRDRSRFRLPPSVRGDVPQIRWISAYVNEILKSQASWFIITTDSSYIIMENLIPSLMDISNEAPTYSFIGNSKRKTFHILVLNRAAIKFLSKAYSMNICASHSYKALHSCLGRIGHAKKFNIETDGNGRKRYLVQNRHMALNELKENTKNGQYSDGGMEFKQLSPHLHSFYNLLAKEIIWYHTMMFGLSRTNE